MKNIFNILIEGILSTALGIGIFYGLLFGIELLILIIEFII